MAMETKSMTATVGPPRSRAREDQGPRSKGVVKSGIAEAIAHARLGLDVSGRPLGRLDLAAQVRDVGPQDLGVVAVGGPPYLLEEGPVREQPPRVLGQRAQQLELDRSQVDLLAVAADAVRGQVDLEAVGADHRLLLLR